MGNKNTINYPVKSFDLYEGIVEISHINDINKDIRYILIDKNTTNFKKDIWYTLIYRYINNYMNYLPIGIVKLNLQCMITRYIGDMYTKDIYLPNSIQYLYTNINTKIDKLPASIIQLKIITQKYIYDIPILLNSLYIYIGINKKLNINLLNYLCSIFNKIIYIKYVGTDIIVKFNNILISL